MLQKKKNYQLEYRQINGPNFTLSEQYQQLTLQTPNGVYCPNKMNLSFLLTITDYAEQHLLYLLHVETIPFFSEGIVSLDGQQVLYMPLLDYVNKVLGRCFQNEMKHRYRNNVFFRKRERPRVPLLSLVNSFNFSVTIAPDPPINYTLNQNPVRRLSTYDLPHLFTLYGQAIGSVLTAGGDYLVDNVRAIPQKGYVQYDAMNQQKLVGDNVYSQAEPFFINIPLNLLFPQSFFDLEMIYIRDVMEIRLTINPVGDIITQLYTDPDDTTGQVGVDNKAKCSNLIQVLNIADYVSGFTNILLTDVCLYAPSYKYLDKTDVEKQQIFGFNDVRYKKFSASQTINEVVKFSRGEPGSKLNWQILTFFSPQFEGTLRYANPLTLVNPLLNNISINIDGQVILPPSTYNSSQYLSTWQFYMSNDIDIDIFEWQYQNHFWFFDYREGKLNGKDSQNEERSFQFQATAQYFDKTYILISNFTKVLVYDNNYQAMVL